jgi:DNA polymerase elongation subunit (family B)
MNHDKSAVVVDIETVGKPFDDLDEECQQYLVRFARTAEEVEQEKLKVNLYPYTAMVACIGMYNVASGKGQVLIQSPGVDEPWKTSDGNMECLPMSEPDLLRRFWSDVSKFGKVVTFNGRNFDAPFLNVRSAIHRIRPSVNLVGYRYDVSQHCDLLDQLSFYGAFRRFSLDFVCKGFGIDSPKAHGVTGLDINSLFADGKYGEIAEYNYRDLRATAELYSYWDTYLNMK